MCHETLDLSQIQYSDPNPQDYSWSFTGGIPCLNIDLDSKMKTMRLICAVIVFVALAASVHRTHAQDAVEIREKRPNFLVIVVDDQSPLDLRTYAPDSALQSPHIDQLATSGMVFESARHMGSWSGAVCSPSRRMIMSGRTLWHLPSTGRQFYNPDLRPDIAKQTMGAVFNRAGYRTMRTCKKGNTYPDANAEFTVVRDQNSHQSNDAKGSGWHGQQVLDYLSDREAAEETAPFLIYFGFSHPHDPRNGKPELLAKYGATNHTDRDSIPPANPKQPKLPPNYLNAHPFFHGHPGLRDEEKVPGVWKNRDEQTVRNEQGRDYACSENIDIQIGKVLGKLEAMGELENTYVLYTSDHGIAIGRHGLMGKQNLYEHTWRVPFLIMGPGITPGQRAKGNIYLLDMLPTLCDLAGIQIPETVQGKSFVPVIKGEQETIRDVMYGAYCGGTKPGMRSVMQGDWKLIQYDLMNGAIRKVQLFNLAENPHEFLAEHHAPENVTLTGVAPTSNQKNLAVDPLHAVKLKEMKALLLSEMRHHDDPYRFSDQPDDGVSPRTPPNNPTRRRRR